MPPGCFLEIARMAREHFAGRGIKSNKGLEATKSAYQTAISI
jgi:hypothetical protein